MAFGLLSCLRLYLDDKDTTEIAIERPFQAKIRSSYRFFFIFKFLKSNFNIWQSPRLHDFNNWKFDINQNKIFQNQNNSGFQCFQKINKHLEIARYGFFRKLWSISITNSSGETENLKETVEKLKIWLLRLVRDSAIQKVAHGFEEAAL